MEILCIPIPFLEPFNCPCIAKVDQAKSAPKKTNFPNCPSIQLEKDIKQSMKTGQPELTSQHSGSEKNLEGEVRDTNAHPPDRKVEVTGLHQNPPGVAPSEDANMTDLEVSRHVNSNVNSLSSNLGYQEAMES